MSSGEREPAMPRAAAMSSTPAREPTVRIHADPPETRRRSPVPDPGRPDDLTRIRRIDRALCEKLIRFGITHFEQIADFTATDVRSMSAALGLGRRIYRETWIEQAALLALRRTSAPAETGGDGEALPATTQASLAGHARVLDQPVAAVKPPAPEAEPPNAAQEPEAAMCVETAVSAAASRIWADVAAARAIVRTEDPVARVAPDLDPVPACQIESETEPEAQTDATTVASAEPLRALYPDAENLRSRLATAFGGFRASLTIRRIALTLPATTRLEVLREREAEPDAVGSDGTAAEIVREAQEPDDLSLIHDIPEAVVTRLVDLGVSRFSEVAAFDAGDVAALSSEFGLGERIQRECWIEQAALLATQRLSKAARLRRNGGLATAVPQAARGLPFPDPAFRALATQTGGQASPQSAGRIALITAPLPPPLESRERHGPATPSAETVAALVAMVAETASSVATARTATPAGHAVPPQPLPPPLPLPPPRMPLPTFSESFEPMDEFDPVAAHAAEYPEDDEFDEDLSPLFEEEAEVTITPRRRSTFETADGEPRRDGDADETAALVNPILEDIPLAAPGSLKSRLMKATGATDVDAESYAAYHRDIGEAAVEIVRRRNGEPPAGGRGEAASDGGGRTRPDPASADKDRERVARFLKALRGG